MKWFDQQPTALAALEAVLRDNHPTLHAFVEDGVVTVRGCYSVVHRGKEIDRYSIAMRLPDNYPHDLPQVFETGGRIPRELDRHVFPSGALCLGVREELWLTLKGDFSVPTMLEGPVRGFLIGNALVEEGAEWPDGDRSHGMTGIMEFYEGHLGVKDPGALLDFMVAMTNGKVRGHWKCPCGSGAIIRKCHKDAVRALQELPKHIIVQSGMMILEVLKARRSAA